MSLRPWTQLVQAALLVATASACDGEPAGKSAARSSDGGIAGSVVAGAGGSSGVSGDGAGVGGAAGTGGAAGAPGGTAGAGALGGAAGKGNANGTPDVCSFELAAEPSTAIPTVGVVNWSTDLAELDEASIEFTLNDPAPGILNVGSGGPIDVTGTTHRALMLGLKAERTYTYRIVAHGGGKVCVSADRTLTTGAGTERPVLTRASQNAAAQARGFIITSSGYGGTDTRQAFVIDADGEVVWWAHSPQLCGRALMDWDGANMWLQGLDPLPGGAGQVFRVALDGTYVHDIRELALSHHDLAALPGGAVATLIWSDSSATTSSPSDLVEWSPDGTLRTVVRIDNQILPGGYHANSLRYHLADDTYTVSDLFAKTYVKLTRQGQLLWQFGGDCAGTRAPKCADVAFTGNHGHHLLDNGNLLFFSANSTTSPVYEYGLAETETTLTSSLVWTYEMTGSKSAELGDVQRLPNGNTLVTYSTDGEIHEVTPAGELVQTISAHAPDSADVASDSFGYVNFRETLYGPPLR